MEALTELRRRNKSGDKKAYYDAIEKELKVLEQVKTILKNNASNNDIDTIQKLWEVLGLWID